MLKFRKEKEDDIPAFYELSLKKVKITGDVFGRFGEFTIEQFFCNTKAKPLEISYTFPITERAVVTGFRVQVGKKVMHGICKEKEEAKKEYVDNLLKGNSAYMLNQDTGNVFDVMVGKVLPGEEVHITISYLDLYDVVDNKIRLIIPTLVNQRYKSSITDGLSYGKVDYTVDFKINIYKVLEYTDVKSINHKVTKTEDEKNIVITAEKYDMSKDFVLDMSFKETSISNACYSNTKDGEKAVLLSFMPELEEQEDSEKEYIFVADVSGSMGSSDKIKKMKDALKRCLNELDVGDKFNILPFESRFTYFQIESVEATEENIEKAIKFVDELHPMGGTEILNPIQFALYEKTDNKVIIVLTDGEVGNEDQIVNFVSQNIYNSKLFALGIDTSVNTSFIKNLAKAGNGKAEFIYPNEDMEDAIVRTFARIQSPLVTNVKVDYGKNELIGEIKQDSTLFNYEFYQVVALLKDISDDITLTGMIGEKKVSWTIAKEDIIQIDGKVELIYAKKYIDMLDEQIRSYEKDFRNENARAMIEEYKKKIIEYSVKFNIASKYTSFISVNEREEKVFESTEFENVRLSNAELMQDMAAPTFLRVNRKCGIGSQMQGKHLDMAISYECMPSDYEDGKTIDENEKDIVEENFDDWKSFDIYTFLLAIIYLKRSRTTLALDSIFKEYVEQYKEDFTEENVQKILFYMYDNQIFARFILDNLLSGIYKKIAITRAQYHFNILELDLGKDNSKILSNGRTMRQEILRRLSF